MLKTLPRYVYQKHSTHKKQLASSFLWFFILFFFCLFVCMLFQCRDTYYIESFHNCLLIYVSQRIHFSDKVYNMRVHLACLDWVSIHNSHSMYLLSNKEVYWWSLLMFLFQNENVDRDVYTTQTYQSIKRPDRVAPFRVLKPKTFSFKENIWATFYTFNWWRVQHLVFSYTKQIIILLHVNWNCSVATLWDARQLLNFVADMFYIHKLKQLWILCCLRAPLTKFLQFSSNRIWIVYRVLILIEIKQMEGQFP